MAAPDPRPASPSALPRDPAPADPPPVGAPVPEEPPPVRPVAVAAPPPVLDAGHRLPAHQGKVGRVTDHVKGATHNLTEWIELRIALLKREVKDEVQVVKAQLVEMAKAYGAVAVLGLVAAVVGLFVLGFFLSALWGLLLGDERELWSLTLGFFTMMVLFGAGAAVAYKRAEAKKQTLSLFGSSPPSVDPPPPAA